jgi:hypothetical protein
MVSGRPNHVLLFPWLDLFNCEARIRVEQGLGQVGPQRIAIEIGGVKPIPRGFVGMTGEGPARIVANFDHLAGVGLENQPVGREADMTIGRAEPAKRCALCVSVGLVGRVSEQPSLALELP